MKKYVLFLAVSAFIFSCDIKKKDKIADDAAKQQEMALKDSTTVQIIDSSYNFGKVTDGEKVEYNYSKSDPIIETEKGTYAEKSAPIITETITWNHSMSEVVNSLIKHGLEINSLDEFDYSPYNCFNRTEEFEPGKYRIKHLGNKIPMVYSIGATKK